MLEFASSSVDGRLSPADERLTIQVESLTGPTTPTPALSHSYTSLQSYEECPRQHYLDYVVNAYPDYRATGENDSDGISQRDIGLLFHDTAEQAANEGTADRADWYEICERLASQRRADDALDPAKQCIDRYFDLELSAYDIIDAEREFELDIDGHELIGFIDAVYRTPDDELLVIDYKATERHRDLYDETVTQAGYAYVGDIGPTVETRTFSEYSAGDHCRWCQHNQLPCAPDSLQPE